jgi:exosortase
MNPPTYLKLKAMPLLALLALFWVSQDYLSGILRPIALDPEASHAVIALASAGFLLWARRTSIYFSSQGNPWSIPVITLAVVLIALAKAFGLAMLGHLGVLLSILGTAVFFLTPTSASTLAGPAFMLLVMVPIPGVARALINVPLQSLGTHAAAIAVTLLGVQVQIAGHSLIVSGQELTVTDACAGMRLIWAVLVVALAVSFLFPLSLASRAWIIASAIPLAWSLNVCRLIALTLAAAAGITITPSLHDATAWAVMLTGWLIPVALAFCLQTPAPPAQTTPAKPQSNSLWPALGFNAAALAGAALLYFAFLPSPALPPPQFPYVVGSYVGQDDAYRDLPGSMRDIPSIHRRYVDTISGQTVLLAALSTSNHAQLQGHYPVVCMASQGWVLESKNQYMAPSHSGKIPITIYSFKKPTNDTSLMLVEWFTQPSPGDIPDQRQCFFQSPTYSQKASNLVHLILPGPNRLPHAQAAARLFIDSIQPSGSTPGSPRLSSSNLN